MCFCSCHSYKLTCFSEKSMRLCRTGTRSRDRPATKMRKCSHIAVRWVRCALPPCLPSCMSYGPLIVLKRGILPIHIACSQSSAASVTSSSHVTNILCARAISGIRRRPCSRSAPSRSKRLRVLDLEVVGSVHSDTDADAQLISNLMLSAARSTPYPPLCMQHHSF